MDNKEVACAEVLWPSDSYELQSRPLMGVEIINNDAESKDLKFLGMEHRWHMHRSGLSVRSILGDVIYEDSNMSILIDYLFQKRNTQVFSIIFHTSLLYGAFNGKSFQISSQEYGGKRQDNFHLSKYVNKIDSTKAEIETMFYADFRTHVEQTKIEPGERLMILFDLGSRQFHGMEDMIEKANKLYGADKRRKILLTI